MKMKRVYFFVDNIRNIEKAPVDDVGIPIIIRNYKYAINFLQEFMSNGYEILIDLDHDLGTKQSGYDIAKWIVESEYKNLRFRVHSMNPAGTKNITELLTHYGYDQF